MRSKPILLLILPVLVLGCGGPEPTPDPIPDARPEKSSNAPPQEPKPKERFTCPDRDSLDCRGEECIEWVNCMPGPGSSGCWAETDSAREYEEWVSENCGFTLEVKGAY